MPEELLFLITAKNVLMTLYIWIGDEEIILWMVLSM